MPHDADATFRGFRVGEDAFRRARHAASIPSTSWRVTSRNGPAKAARYRFVARLGSPPQLGRNLRATDFQHRFPLPRAVVRVTAVVGHFQPPERHDTIPK